MNKKKIIFSLSMIAVVAVVVMGATGAYFSDVETSTGNTFTAGPIDLQIDSESYYNGVAVPAATWALKDLVPTADKFFNFADLKPGDEGDNSISLHVTNNDAWVCVEVSNLTDYENGQTEPEASVDATTGTNEGELSQTMEWVVWRDDGAGGGVAGDNIQNGTEQTLTSGNPANGVFSVYDSTTGTGPLLAVNTGYLGVAWSFPGTSGNETQSDTMMGNISLHVEQSRNNANFTCGSIAPEGGEDNGQALGPLPVNLLTAYNYAIVAKTAITDANPSLSSLTGDIVIDPAAGSAITGLSCSSVTGTMYSSGGYTGGYNSNTSCSITDPVIALSIRTAMETAYTDAANRPSPTATDLGAGNIGGMTLAPGLYKWNSDVTIPNDVTLLGDANDVWIFQIAGNLDIASGGSPSGGADVILAGGALAKNVFWQVGGDIGATLGTYSTFKGTLLTAKQIILQSGAVLSGRALSQTQVVLDANIVTRP